MKQSTVLITGVSGFVGSHLKPYLERQFRVIGASRRGTGATLDYKELLASEMACDAVVHLAGKAHDLRKVTSEHEYYEANFELTKKVFEGFLNSSAKTFIYLSSVKAVRDTVEGALTESVPANPITAYGKSKKMAEDYLLSHGLRGKRVFVLRPCMIHGPGNKGNLNLLYAVVSRGVPYPLAAFHNARSFLSVDNLCFVIEQLLTRDIPSGIYNVADDGALSTDQVVELIAASLNKKARLIKVPKILVTSIASVGGVLRLPLDAERLRKLTENYVVDNTKIKAALCCDLPLSITEGLSKTFASFRHEASSGE